MSFLIRAAVARGRGRAPGHQGQRQGRPGVVRQGAQAGVPERRRPTRCSSKQSGQTEADLLFRQRTQLIEQKITEKLTKGTTDVSQADVTEYYNKNKSKQFTQPATRDLLVILTKTEAQAKAAKAALEGGMPFDEAVKKYSTDPTTKANGGQLLNVTEGQGEKAFDKAVFAAKKGQVYGPVKTSEGYYVFQVTRITPAKTQPLDNQLRASIKQIIVSENQRNALTKFGKEYQDRWRGETECAKGYIVPDCANSKTKPASTVPPGAVPQPTAAPQQQTAAAAAGSAAADDARGLTAAGGPAPLVSAR